MPLSPNFQRTLKKALTESDAGKAQIAERVGVTRATLYNWRDGNGRPDGAEATLLAEALGIPVSELWIPDEPLTSSDRHRLAVLDRFLRRVREAVGDAARELAEEGEPAPAEPGVPAREDVGQRGEPKPPRRRPPRPR